MADDRKVTTTLDITLGPDGLKALTALADAAKKAGEVIRDATKGGGGKSAADTAVEIEKKKAQVWKDSQDALFKRSANLSMAGFGGIGHRMAGAGMAAEGLHGLGATGMAAGVQKAAPMIAAAAMVADISKQMALVANDPFATRSQMGRSFIKSGVIPGADKALEFADAFSGRAGRMEVADYDASLRAQDAGRRGAQAGFASSFDPSQAGRSARAAGFRGLSALAPPSGERSTAEGRLLFQQEQQRYGLRVQMQKADVEITATAKERAKAESEFEKIKRSEQDLNNKLLTSEKALAKVGSGPERQAILRERQNILEEKGKAQENLRGAAEGVFGARVREGEAKANRERLTGAMAGVRAEQAEQMASTFRGGAQRIGGMTAIEREQSVQYLGLAVQPGMWEGLPQEIKNQVRAFAPNKAQELDQAAGMSSGVNARAAQLSPTDFGDPVKKDREAVEERKRQAESEFRADRDLAETAAEAGAKMGDIVREIINRLFDGFKQKIEADKNVSKNNV